MKRLACALAWIVLAAGPLCAGDSTGTITVIVKGLRNDKGKVVASLHNIPAAFPKDAKRAVKRMAGTIKDKKCSIVLDKIPFGEYAIVIFHDENNSGKMEYSTFGIPEEGYGFSNDAKAMLGPPDFKDAKFKLDGPKKDVPITLNY